MKVVAVLLALAVFGANAAPKADVDVPGRIREVIDEILDNINEPAVDVHDERYSLDLLIEKLEFLADNVVLKGLKNLDIVQLDYDESTGHLDYDFTFSEISALVDLELNLSGLINLKHHPIVDVLLNNLKFSGYAVIDTSKDVTEVTDIKVLISLGSAKVDLTDILNDDELTEALNTLLNAELPNMVNNIAAALEPVTSPIIQAVINILIRETTSN